MDFKKLIEDNILKLPLNQKDNRPFNLFIKDTFDEFLEKIHSQNIDFFIVNGIKKDRDFIIKTQEIIINGLTDCINEYYNGNTFKSYQKLDSILKNEIKNLYSIINKKEFDVNENFYRLRYKDDNFSFSSKEMFHIPFESRGKVTSQRYSIPGFPSLYLSRTLYVCWEELMRPQINNFQAVRLKNIKKIALLDLSPPSSKDNMNSFYKYFMTWPLIASCSVKVKEKENPFKPEYIIPQLLLQWVRNNDELDGISYQSTHIGDDFNRQEGDYSNIVLPVKKSEMAGYCINLNSKFEMTEAVSWQLHQLALGGATLIGTRSEGYVDFKIPKIELIKGKKYPYSYSILGKLENYLDNLETSKII